MKFKTFFPALAAMLLTGSAVSDTVKIAGADRYQVTVNAPLTIPYAVLKA